METKRAAIYARVSTDKQEYTRQLEQLKSFAKTNNLSIDLDKHIFEETESGLNSDRPKYNELIKLNKEDIDVLLIWELSRLSRKSLEIQTDIQRFSDKGINVYIYDKSLYTLNPNTTRNSTTDLIISIVATIAEQEIRTLKQRVKASRHQYVLKEGRSYTSQAAFGYTLENKQLSVNSDSELVKRIFQLSIEGNSMYSIAVLLNSEGLKSSKGGNWTAATIASMLNNTAYYGEAKYVLNAKLEPSIVERAKTGKRKPTSRKILDKTFVSCPYIITKEVFDLAKEKRTERRSKSASKIGQPYLLKHLVICPDCNNFYTFDRANSRERYKCARQYNLAKNTGIKCKSPIIEANKLEFLVWETMKLYCSDILSDDKKQLQKEPLEAEIVQFNLQISGIDKQIKELSTKAELIINVAIDIKEKFPDMPNLYNNKMDEVDSINKDVRRINKEKSTIQNSIDKATKQIVSIDAIKDTNFYLSDSSFDSKFDVLHKLIESIKLFGGGSTSLIVLTLKTGQIIYLGYYPFRFYFTIFFNSNDVIFDEITKTGIIKTLDNQTSSNFSFNNTTNTYSITEFVDQFNTINNRISIK